ncbi:MAG: PDZ domain-containing protein, partial [Bacteroidota bacterium]
KDPIWVNDSTLIFSSDRGGNFDLYSITSKDPNERNLYKTFKLDIRKLTNSELEEEGTKISPDRKKLAYRRGRGQLVVANISPSGSLSGERTLVNGWATATDLSWSPDSKWVAYSMDDLEFNQEVYIHNVSSGDPVNISLHPRVDDNPIWSKDGSKLGFLSTRNNGDSDVWFVWLKKEDWERTKRDWDEEEDEAPKAKSKKDKDAKKSVEPIQIDFEDIHERLVQVTRLAGNEANLAISKDGEQFYFHTNAGGRAGSPGKPDFMSVKWDGSELKTLFPDFGIRGLTLSKDGKAMYGLKSGNVQKVKPKEKKKETLRFNAKIDVDHHAQRKQIFEEGWRRLNDGFYDPNFHGQDWKALKEKYYDRCMNASTSQDFTFHFNEMLGQLNASHMGLFGSNPEKTQRESTGQLGVSISPVTNGVQIKRVIPRTPADRTESKLQAGDIIKAVNGKPIKSSVKLYSLFN